MNLSFKGFYGLLLSLALILGCGGGGGGSNGDSSGDGSSNSAPSAPSSISATAGDGQIAISWSAVAGTTSYNIYWATTSGVTKTSGIKISSVTSPYTHTGRTNGITYYYVVTAENSYGESSESTQVSAMPQSATGTGKMSDTNQTTSYTTTFGEDHDYTINSPSYINNGNGTITDNVTDLIWQRQDDGTTRAWADAVTYCDNLVLGGQTDWRLPSRIEFISIFDYDGYNPSINTTYFPGTVSSYYWASTPKASNTSQAWLVGFGSGNTTYSYKTSTVAYARCVRGIQAISNLTDNGDGTVTDSGTFLTWQQGESSSMTWEATLSYCEGLSLAGQTDWRLPNIKELSSIVDDTRYSPAIDIILFPNANSLNYWSSTTNSNYTFYAWGVDFNNGDTLENISKSNSYYARCVRGGQ